MCIRDSHSTALRRAVRGARVRRTAPHRGVLRLDSASSFPSVLPRGSHSLRQELNFIRRDVPQEVMAATHVPDLGGGDTVVLVGHQTGT
eukprot:3227963-Prymnesium_polylepis.1